MIASSGLTIGGVTMLCPRARHFIHSLVLFQHRNTENRLDKTGKLLTGT